MRKQREKQENRRKGGQNMRAVNNTLREIILRERPLSVTNNCSPARVHFLAKPPVRILVLVIIFLSAGRLFPPSIFNRWIAFIERPFSMLFVFFAAILSLQAFFANTYIVMYNFVQLLFIKLVFCKIMYYEIKRHEFFIKKLIDQFIKINFKNNLKNCLKHYPF